MVLKALPLRLVLAFLLCSIAGLAAAQTKPRIDKAADLPRFTYKIDGKVENVVRSADQFAPFAAAVRRNTESVLADYDIADKSTRSNLLGISPPSTTWTGTTTAPCSASSRSGHCRTSRPTSSLPRCG
jgi:hypothetical protein